MNSVAVPSPEDGGLSEVCLDEEPPGTKSSPLVYRSEHGEDYLGFVATAEVSVAQVRSQSGRPPIAVPTQRPHRRRGIVVLYSQTEKLDEAKDSDILADLETIATAETVAQVLRQHTQLDVHLLPASQNVAGKLLPYPPEDYLVFNLFEGLDDLAGEHGNDLSNGEANTAFLLQQQGYRFTGADGHTLALALNKAQTKALLEKGGVLTPPWRVVAHVDEVSERILGQLTFPLVVKPVAKDSSLGIDADAVVTDLHSLRERVGYIVARYHQAALVESFIEGREFNVAIWGNPPQVLPLAEVELGALGSPWQRIVSFAAKWQETSFEYLHTPVTCPAVVAEDLAAHIRETALRAWQIIGSHGGYARVDVRVQDGKAYVLEVNPNPSVAPDAGLARAARAAGLDYAQMILTILAFVEEEARVHHT